MHLVKKRNYYASILSGMADGVITFNRDGTILMTNPPAELFLQNWYFEKKNQENIDRCSSIKGNGVI